jgi:hypothetical protein
MPSELTLIVYSEYEIFLSSLLLSSVHSISELGLLVESVIGLSTPTYITFILSKVILAIKFDCPIQKLEKYITLIKKNFNFIAIRLK